MRLVMSYVPVFAKLPVAKCLLSSAMQPSAMQPSAMQPSAMQPSFPCQVACCQVPVPSVPDWSCKKSQRKLWLMHSQEFSSSQTSNSTLSELSRECQPLDFSFFQHLPFLLHRHFLGFWVFCHLIYLINKIPNWMSIPFPSNLPTIFSFTMCKMYLLNVSLASSLTNGTYRSSGY